MAEQPLHWFAVLMDGALRGRMGPESQAAAERAFEIVGGVVRDTVDLLHESGLIPPPVPEEPRARALHLRQHRNTGPAQQEAARARRPRRP